MSIKRGPNLIPEIVGLLLASILLFGLLVLFNVFSDSKSKPSAAVVTSASTPNVISLLGEVVLYRFTVSAEKDVAIDTIYFGSDPQFLFQDPQQSQHLYDDGNGDQLPGKIVNSARGISYRPLWPLMITKGTSRTFALRGTIMRPGTAIIWIDNLTLKEGKVTGLPTAAVALTVGGRRE